MLLLLAHRSGGDCRSLTVAVLRSRCAVVVIKEIGREAEASQRHTAGLSDVLHGANVGMLLAVVLNFALRKNHERG